MKSSQDLGTVLIKASDHLHQLGTPLAHTLPVVLLPLFLRCAHISATLDVPERTEVLQMLTDGSLSFRDIAGRIGQDESTDLRQFFAYPDHPLDQPATFKAILDLLDTFDWKQLDLEQWGTHFEQFLQQWKTNLPLR